MNIKMVYIIKKTILSMMIVIVFISACKKPDAEANVDQIITAHYLFKPGTYWVYNGSNFIDSQYVIGNGTKNGFPYMQIHDVVRDRSADTICSFNTIYIGAGPASNQLQLWGYDLVNHTDAQVIFQADTPVGGTIVAQGCIFSSIMRMGGLVPYGVSDWPICYVVDYASSNKNQEYGRIDYYFSPDFGIVQKDVMTLPYTGRTSWNLYRSHIIH